MSDPMSAPRPRLSPLALPPATAGLFLLLIAAALASSAHIYAWLTEHIGLVSNAPAQCAQAAQAATGQVTPDGLVDWYVSCIGWTNTQVAAFVAMMITAFGVVTIVIYLSMPSRIVRGLRPLEKVESDPTLSHLASQIRQTVAEDPSLPRLEIYVDMAAGGGDRAFGHIGRYRLVLGTEAFKRPANRPDDPRLRSVLAHELAHIRNRDINLTYLTIAVWWGFLAAVALPFVAVATRAPALLLNFSCRIAILLALLWFVRVAVLRAREFYADARAAQPSADAEEGLVEALCADDSLSPRPILDYHPKPEQRVEVIRSGERLFRLSPWVATATGALVGLAYTPAYYLVSLALPNRLFERGWVTAAGFGLLVAAVLTGSVWRAALWAATEGATLRTWPTAVGFTVALLAGQVATPQLPTAGTWAMVLDQSPVVAVVVGLLLLLATAVFLRWTRLAATTWLSLAGDPRRAYRFGILQSAAVFAIWLAAWFQFAEYLSFAGSTWPIFWLAVLTNALNPLVIVSLTWVCGYALATWQSRRMAQRRRAFPWWRGAVAAGREPFPPMRTPLLSVYAVVVAALAAYAIVVLPDYPELRAALSWINREDNPPVEAYVAYGRLLVLPALLAAVVGTLVLGYVVGGRHRLAQALAAAGLTALPLAIVLFLTLLWHTIRAEPSGPGLLTLLSGLSGLDLGGAEPTGAPQYGSLGLLVALVNVVLLLLCLPAAAVGSLARSVFPHLVRRSARSRLAAAPRSPLAAAALLAPLALATATVGYLDWTEWRVAYTVSIATAPVVDHREVERIINSAPTPGSVPVTDSCVVILQTVVGIDFGSAGTARGGGALDEARVAAAALSSDDPTLRILGEATVEALRASELRRAAYGMAASLHYCAASGALS